MRRVLTPERAARLQQATAQSVMDHLRVAGVNVPANILAQGLAAALVEMLGHVKPKNRAEVFERCASIMGAAVTR